MSALSFLKDPAKIPVKKALSLTDGPGIYVFWGKKEPLYVGKAVNLKRRVRSYFYQGLLGKTKEMVDQIDFISTIAVSSEIEALLLEAKAVSLLSPKYNVSLKDDKHPLYIRLTREDYPRVLTARKKNLQEFKKDLFWGPFPSSTNVKKVLKTLRKIFPYAEHKVGKRKCLYAHLGLCQPCPSWIENEAQDKEKEKGFYKRNILRVKRVLDGRIGWVRNDLTLEMRKLSKENKFEEAQEILKKRRALDYITQPINQPLDFLKNPSLLTDLREEEKRQLTKVIAEVYPGINLKRIECYDVSHLKGTKPTASMVTFVNGEADKDFYRHFRIRQKRGMNDIASLKEVAKRRKAHFSDWGYPDLVIVDGGKGQVKVFDEAFSKDSVPVVGLAKAEETLVFPTKSSFLQRKLKRGPARNLAQRLRNEAHRFARRYHHLLVRKSLIPPPLS